MTDIRNCNSNNFLEKTEAQIKYDTDIINKHISRLTGDMVLKIKQDANISETATASIFRPKIDLAMLIFKEKNGNSLYTINLRTMKTTSNSPCKCMIDRSIIDTIMQ
jgi:hypothetical protein